MDLKTLFKGIFTGVFVGLFSGLSIVLKIFDIPSKLFIIPGFLYLLFSLFVFRINNNFPLRIKLLKSGLFLVVALIFHFLILFFGYILIGVSGGFNVQ